MHIILFGIYLYNDCYANGGKVKWRSTDKRTKVLLCERLADVYELASVVGKDE